MTQPGFDGVIRGAGEAGGFGDRGLDDEEDPLREVRHLLDRLYASVDAPESEYQELVRQILLAGVDAPETRA